MNRSANTGPTISAPSTHGLRGRARSAAAGAALALDIGGANLKAACRSNDGDRALAWSMPFPLWREPARLSAALRRLTRQARPWDRLLVTMTGELCDCFADKAAGVQHIVDACESLAGRRPVHVWSVTGEWLRPTTARRRWVHVAAANWHAQAAWLARQFPQGASLLMDTGSTTTDIILLRRGAVAAQAMTDIGRLATGELVYVGGRRTPLCALGPRVAHGGRERGTMAEFFATLADAAVLIGAAPARPDDTDTADGRPMTQLCAAARVLRMVGADLRMVSLQDARHLAEAYVDEAARRIVVGLRSVCRGRRLDCVIVSGSGAWLAERALARWAGSDRLQVVRLSSMLGPDAADAACAVALLELDGDNAVAVS